MENIVQTQLLPGYTGERRYPRREWVPASTGTAMAAFRATGATIESRP